MSDEERKEISLVDKTDLPNILHSLRFSLLIMCAFRRLFLALTDALGEEKVGREKPSKYINKLWSFQKFHFPQ